MNPEKAMFIAFDGEKAAGYSYVAIKHERCFSDERGPYGCLDTIYVHPDYRRQGIAQTLVAMCEDWAREKGCTEFASGCDLDNERSFASISESGSRRYTGLFIFPRACKEAT